MLKVLARKGSTRRVADYLTRGEATREVAEYLTRNGRSLAFDSNAYDFDEDWSRGMDETRRSWGKDSPDGRSYYHMVVSPDPRDDATLEQVRDLVRSWMGERYPESEWVAHYHDDNGITHAHIVMNAVLPSTGKKVHMSNADVRGDAEALQRLSRERGLSYFEGPRIVRTEDGWDIDGGCVESVGARRREEQRRVREDRSRRGERVGGSHHRRPGSWIDETRDSIDECVAGCRDWTQFRERMEARGFGIRVTHRRGSGTGVTFTHPRGRTDKRGGYRVKGWRLDPTGGAYSYSGILSRLQPNLADGRTYSSVVREARRGAPQPFEERLRERASLDARLGIQEIADAYAYAHRHGIGSAEDMDERARALRESLANAEERLESARVLLDRSEGAAEALEADGAHPSAETRAMLSDLGLGTGGDGVKLARERSRTAVAACEREVGELRGELSELSSAKRVVRSCGVLLPREPVGTRGIGASAFLGRPPLVVRGANAPDFAELLEEHARLVAEEAARSRRAARVRVRVSATLTYERRGARHDGTSDRTRRATAAHDARTERVQAERRRR